MPHERCSLREPAESSSLLLVCLVIDEVNNGRVHFKHSGKRNELEAKRIYYTGADCLGTSSNSVEYSLRKMNP